MVPTPLRIQQIWMPFMYVEKILFYYIPCRTDRNPLCIKLTIWTPIIWPFCFPWPFYTTEPMLVCSRITWNWKLCFKLVIVTLKSGEILHLVWLNNHVPCFARKRHFHGLLAPSLVVGYRIVVPSTFFMNVTLVHINTALLFSLPIWKMCTIENWFWVQLKPITPTQLLDIPYSSLYSVSSFACLQYSNLSPFLLL